MKKILKSESFEIIESFFEKLKKTTQNNKTEIKIEFFELRINDLIYEKCDCAYLQNENNDEGILFDALSQRYFYIKSELVGDIEKRTAPVLFVLDNQVFQIIPKAIQDKMLLVLQNKQDEKVCFEDFGLQFSLTKPTS